MPLSCGSPAASHRAVSKPVESLPPEIATSKRAGLSSAREIDNRLTGRQQLGCGGKNGVPRYQQLSRFSSLATLVATGLEAEG